MKTKLDILDFDDTLIKSPGPAEYEHVKSIAESQGIDMATEDEIEGNHYFWWDHPVSLSSRIFRFKPFEGLMRIKEEEPLAKTAIVTHRVPTEDMRAAVNDILGVIGVNADWVELCGRSVRTKIDAIRPILEELRPLERIRIFEDSIEELGKYHDFFTQQITYEVSEVDYYLINQKNIFQVNPRALRLGILGKVGTVHLSSEAPVYK